MTFSPKQIALSLGVSEASLKRWCDKGLLDAKRTAGGHRRISKASVLAFLRTSGRPLVDPTALSLPSSTVPRTGSLCDSLEALIAAMQAGDEAQFRLIVLGHFIGGHSATQISDELLTPAFAHLGEHWEQGNLEVYKERRGCELCLKILYELMSMLPEPQSSAPRAIGATAEGDLYAIPTLMVGLALKELGWRARSYGTHLPFATLYAAIRSERPRLFWLSVSHLADPEKFITQFNELHDLAATQGTALVAGGRALTQSLRQQLRYATFCDNLRHLRSFVGTL